MHKTADKILEKNWDKILKMLDKGKKIAEIANKYHITRGMITDKLKATQGTVVKKPTTGLKILILDIENAPMLSYHWGLWQQNIHKEMRVDQDRSYMMSIAMKWLDEPKVHYFETRSENDSQLVKKALEFIEKADIIVGHNAKKFDMKKINAYAILNGLKPPTPYRIIDTMLVAKKEFSFERNTLDYLTNKLCTQTKSSHGKFSGFELWAECMKGNEEAWKEMQYYNKQDVLATEELYLKLRPYIKSHPNVAVTANSTVPVCTACGHTNITKAGFSITQVSKFQRYKCKECGSYSRGRTNLLDKDIRKELLTAVANG